MQTMKTTVSTTALSILVALGVTACSSTPKDETNTTGSTQNTPINPQAGQNTQSDANAKAKSEANAKADAEAKSKQKRLEAERKAKAEAEAKAKAEKEQAEKEAKAKAEEQKRLEAEAAQKAEEAKKASEADKQRLQEEAAKKAEEARKAREEEKRLDEIRKHKEDEQNKLNAEKLRIENEIKLLEKNQFNKNNQEWRSVHIRGGNPIENKTETFSRDPYTTNARLPEPYDRGYASFYSPFSQTDDKVIVNLDELTKQDIKKGGKFLGEHAGTYKDEAIDGVVWSEPNKQKIDHSDLSFNKAEDVQSINYLFINQPYSSYGALFTSEYDVQLFATGLSTNNYSPLYQHQVVESNGNKVTTDKLIYNDNIKGNATYKGQVIASVSRYIDSLHIVSSKPTVDGTVTLEAYFGDKAEKNYVKGEIDSKTVGKIELGKLRIGTNTNYGAMDLGDKYAKIANLPKNASQFVSRHDIAFVGENAQEVVGEVSTGLQYVDSHNNGLQKEGNIMSYQAVYGATRQPK